MPKLIYITQRSLLARSMPIIVNITLATFFYLARGSTKPDGSSRGGSDKNCPLDLTKATNGLHYRYEKKQPRRFS